MKTLSDMTEPELRATMIDAANRTKAGLPPRTMFVVIACDHSNIGQYISNMDRQNIPQFLREVADRIERREDVHR